MTFRQRMEIRNGKVTLKTTNTKQLRKDSALLYTRELNIWMIKKL